MGWQKKVSSLFIFEIKKKEKFSKFYKSTQEKFYFSTQEKFYAEVSCIYTFFPLA